MLVFGERARYYQKNKIGVTRGIEGLDDARIFVDRTLEIVHDIAPVSLEVYEHEGKHFETETLVIGY